MTDQELIARLSDTKAAGRAEAAQQLAQRPEEARAAVLPLVNACGDDDEAVREWAVAALEELGPPPVEQLGAIADLLAAEQADVAYWAATLLGRAGPTAAPATGALAAALADSAPPPVRQRAAWALGKIGPAAAEALPALREAAASDDARLVRLAEQAARSVQAG